MAVVVDIVEFLRRYPPFAELDPAAVDAVAEAVEVEFHPEGATIFAQGAGPAESLRVIRTGAVEVVHDGTVLDVMGPGEMFGHASMLSGLPTGFSAVAAEDTLTYRVPADVATAALSGPRGLRLVARLLLEDPHRLRGGADERSRDALRQPVGESLRGPAVVCAPGDSVREAAARLGAAGATALVVDLGDRLGIVTDADLRERVVVAGRAPDTTVAEVMSAPAHTVTADSPAGEVLLDMLDRGVRHFPVLSAGGRVLGVVEDHDLVAAQGRSSFLLRRAVARADSAAALAEAGRSLRAAVVDLRRGGAGPLDVMSIYSVVTDALVRRAVDLAVADAGEPPAPFAWLSLGSQARREALPASDLDSAISWRDGDDAAVARYLAPVAASVSETLTGCGFAADEHRVSAADPLFARSESSWRAAAREVLDDPAGEKALVIASVLLDSRVVWGVESAPLSGAFAGAAERPLLLRLMARFALSHRPPSGFARGAVVDVAGQRRDLLDLKSAAVVPIVGLARWAALAAGVTTASTPTRLRAARDAGTLTDDDARSLLDAFELVSELRLDHQVGALEAGASPDDRLDPAALSPLARAYLKEAFRAIAAVQHRVANEVAWGA